MTELTKVKLQILKDVHPGTSGDRSNVVQRDDSQQGVIEVQLNPTSLRLERRNNVDRGALTTGTQRRQSPSSEGATLTFDLEFDTADELDPSASDVREKTKLVRQFVEPPTGKPKDAPPRLELQWGTLIFRGIMTQVTEELDYFSPEGRPLRAKLSVVITEQDLKFEKNESGPGAADAQRATPPGSSQSSGPGGSGTNAPTKEVKAHAGESAQQLAARLGGNPTAWRSLMNGLDNPLDLPAGATVQVGVELEASGGLGASLQFGAGLPTTAILSVSAALDATATADAGFVLSGAGGVDRAAALVRGDVALRAAASARASFDVPPGRVSVDADVPDPRALTYGASIPLTARLNATMLQSIRAGGGRSVAPRSRPAEVSVAVRVAQPPWVQLPPDPTGGRAEADDEQRRRDAGASTLGPWR